jgi:hypothetical protein
MDSPGSLLPQHSKSRKVADIIRTQVDEELELGKRMRSARQASGCRRN